MQRVEHWRQITSIKVGKVETVLLYNRIIYDFLPLYRGVVTEVDAGVESGAAYTTYTETGSEDQISRVGT